MNLDKTMTDNILRLTNSKPEQLLTWFSFCYRKFKEYAFPCIENKYFIVPFNPYLYKYFIYSSLISESYVERDEIPFFKNLHIKRDKYGNSVNDIWNYARESKDNFDNLIKQFRELYDLE